MLTAVLPWISPVSNKLFFTQRLRNSVHIWKFGLLQTQSLSPILMFACFEYFPKT